MDSSLIRLLQLSSSALPVGGFTYSQGLEYAVDCGWVTNEQELKFWLDDLIDSNLAQVDIPLLKRMRSACETLDERMLNHCCQRLVAYRETSELRLEEQNRGRALTRLLIDLDIAQAEDWKHTLDQTQLAGMALACHAWDIDVDTMAYGYGWSWLENMVISGVKLVPLGQLAGQRILRDLAEALSTHIQRGLLLKDSEIGSSAPALAFVSASHETQYTRLYRS